MNGLWNTYPYTDFHEMNLDWILSRIRSMEDSIKNFINLNTIKYADPIAWDITSQYESNTVVVDNQSGNAYISTHAVPSGVAISNTDYWTQIFNYASELDTLREQIAAANEKQSTTASVPRAIGDLVWVKGELLRVISPMIAGDSYVIGSNCVKTTIEDELFDSSALDDEIADRIEADNVLQSNIDTEKTDRIEADNVLQSNIDTEKTDRIDGDNAIINRINNMKILNVMDYGAIGDGVADDTNAINACIADAKIKSCAVYFPYGKYRITSTIHLGEKIALIGCPSENTLHGDEPGLRNATIIIDTVVSYNIPAFTCYYGVLIENLRFEWVKNIVGYNPVDYGSLVSSIADPYGTDIMADCTFRNLELVNASRGFYIKTGGRNIFENIKADCSEFFITIEQSRDSIYFKNIHVFPFANTTDVVRREYVRKHCNAFVFVNSDDVHLTDVLILDTLRGILAQADSTDPDYGSWFECENVTFDGTNAECVYMAFPKYAAFSNCRFNSDIKSDKCVYIQAQVQSKVLITSSSFWFAKVGVVNNGAKLVMSACTCEGDISLVQTTESAYINGCMLYGNDMNTIPCNAVLNGEQFNITNYTTTPDLTVPSIGSAAQVAINADYKMHILEFDTTSDDGYGLVNIGTDGTHSSNTYRFKCNGGTYRIPVMCKPSTVDNITCQIVLQSVTALSKVSNIRMYNTEGKNDTVISEIKKNTNNLNPNYICDDWTYDGSIWMRNCTAAPNGLYYPEGSNYTASDGWHFNDGTSFNKVQFEV